MTVPGHHSGKTRSEKEEPQKGGPSVAQGLSGGCQSVFPALEKRSHVPARRGWLYSRVINEKRLLRDPGPSRLSSALTAPIPQLSHVLPLPDKATSQSTRPPCPHSPDSPGRHLITCPTLCGEQTWRTLLSAAARHDQHSARIHPGGQRVTTALSRLERTKVTVLGSHTQDVLRI